MVSAVFLCVIFSIPLLVVAQETATEQKTFEPSRQELDTARKWLWDHPPNGKNRAERRKRMDVIQKASDKLTPAEYRSYTASWGNDDSASDLEQKHPALYYLREATAHALDDINNTTVKEGLAVWYLYNMGYVFKTPESTFGMDIKLRESERLADELDFLLTSHEHKDHSSERLIQAMIKADKPVLTRWKEGTTIINEPSEFNFGSCRVKVDIGDHHYEQPNGQNDMLMYQVDCGGYTIYHSGDGNNYQKMTPDKKVDIFIVHVQVGMSVEEAIGHLNPERTFVSHVLELEHSPNPPNAWRWSFDYAFEQVSNIPKDEAIVLTWGERWLMPGTILRDFSNEQDEGR